MGIKSTIGRLWNGFCYTGFRFIFLFFLPLYLSAWMWVTPSLALEVPETVSRTGSAVPTCNAGATGQVYLRQDGSRTRIIICDGTTFGTIDGDHFLILKDNPIPLTSSIMDPTGVLGSLQTEIELERATTDPVATIEYPCDSAEGEHQYALHNPNKTFWRCTNKATGRWTNLGSVSAFAPPSNGPTVTATASPSSASEYQDVTLTATITGSAEDPTHVYEWSKVSGSIDVSSSNFKNTQTSTATFTAPSLASEGRIVFAVRVTETATATNAMRSTVGTVEVTVQADTTKPTVMLGDLTPDNQDNPATYTSTITLSEAPAGNEFELADLTLTNATATLAKTNDTTYTATLTPSGSGLHTVSLSVGAGTFTDAAGNENTASNTVSVGHGSLAVTLGTLTANSDRSAYTSAITLAAAPKSGTFDEDDLTVTPASVEKALSGSGTSWTATLTPPAEYQGEISLKIEAGAFMTDSDIDNRASNTVRLTRDTIAPTATIGTFVPNAAKTQYVADITLSEEPASGTEFTSSDIAPTGASSATVAEQSPTEYRITVVPSGQGSVGITIRANAFQDAFGNANPEARASFTHDSIAPTVMLGALTLKAGDTVSFTSAIKLSEAPGASTTFALDDLTVTNATALLDKTDDTTYTATLIPTEAGTVTLQVNAGRFTDAAGNDNTASNTVMVSYTDSAPTVMLGALSVNRERTEYRSAITLSAAPVSGDFTKDDLTVSDNIGDVKLEGSGTSWTAILTPERDGLITLSIAAGVFRDVSGNANMVSNAVSRNHDTIGAAVSLGPLTCIVTSGGIQYATTFTLSERWGLFGLPDPSIPQRFDPGDLTVTNGRSVVLQGFGNLMSGRFTFTPGGAGDITAVVPAGRFTDRAGNFNRASNTVRTTHYTTGPTVALGDVTLNTGEEAFYTSSITLNRAPKAGTFGRDDVTVSDNVDVTLDGSGTDWTATLTPKDNLEEGDEITIEIKAGAFQGESCNGNSQSNMPMAAVYNIPPTVTIEGLPERVNNRSPIPVRFVFSESVSGFAVEDVMVVNAVIEGFAGSGTTYTANIVPDGSGDIEVRVPAGVAQDAEDAGNLASAPVSVVSMFTLEVRKRISEFMHRRATSLLANQPDLLPFIRRGGDRGHIDANFAGGYGTFDVASSYGGTYTIWIDGTGSVLKDKSYLLGSLGSHVFLTPNILLGVMAQGDYARDKDSDDSLVKGYGWLIGPYFGVRAPDMDVYFDGRILYGQTDNRIRSESSEGYFDTERWLAKFRVTGEVGFGALALLPHIDFAYTEDHQKSFTDELGSVIGGQHVWLRDITFGLDFDYPLSLQEGGVLALSGGVSAIWNESGGTSSSLQVIDTADKVRSRIDLGLGYHHLSGSVILLDGFYDGLGVSGYESYGGSLNYNLSF